MSFFVAIILFFWLFKVVLLPYCLFSSSFTSFLTNLFTLEADTLALVRLGLAKRANLGGCLTEDLLVAAGHGYDGVLTLLGYGLNLDFRSKLEENLVRIAKIHLHNIAIA